MGLYTPSSYNAGFSQLHETSGIPRLSICRTNSTGNPQLVQLRNPAAWKAFSSHRGSRLADLGHRTYGVVSHLNSLLHAYDAVFSISWADVLISETVPEDSTPLL